MAARRGKREAWLRKYDQLKGLQALLETYEQAKEPDLRQIKHLHRRIREVRTQLDVMSDVGNVNVGEHGRDD